MRTKGPVLSRKMLLLFRDKLIKHLLDNKERGVNFIIEETYKLLTNLTDEMEDN